MTAYVFEVSCRRHRGCEIRLEFKWPPDPRRVTLRRLSCQSPAKDPQSLGFVRDDCSPLAARGRHGTKDLIAPTRTKAWSETNVGRTLGQTEKGTQRSGAQVRAPGAIALPHSVLGEIGSDIVIPDKTFVSRNSPSRLIRFWNGIHAFIEGGWVCLVPIPGNGHVLHAITQIQADHTIEVRWKSGWPRQADAG
jgi:hypothetical protein